MGPVTFNRIAPQLHELGRMLPTTLWGGMGPQPSRARASCFDGTMSTGMGGHLSSNNPLGDRHSSNNLVGHASYSRAESSIMQTKDMHATTAFDIISSGAFEQRNHSGSDSIVTSAFIRQSDPPEGALSGGQLHPSVNAVGERAGHSSADSGGQIQDANVDAREGRSSTNGNKGSPPQQGGGILGSNIVDDISKGSSPRQNRGAIGSLPANGIGERLSSHRGVGTLGSNLANDSGEGVSVQQGGGILGSSFAKIIPKLASLNIQSTLRRVFSNRVRGHGKDPAKLFLNSENSIFICIHVNQNRL